MKNLEHSANKPDIIILAQPFEDWYPLNIININQQISITASFSRLTINNLRKKSRNNYTIKSSWPALFIGFQIQKTQDTNLSSNHWPIPIQIVVCLSLELFTNNSHYEITLFSLYFLFIESQLQILVKGNYAEKTVSMCLW